MIQKFIVGIFLSICLSSCKIKTDAQYKTDLNLAMTEGMIAGYGLAQEELIQKFDKLTILLRPIEPIKESQTIEDEMDNAVYILRS